MDADAHGDGLLVRQLPGGAVQVARDPEVARHGELPLLPFYYSDVFHAIDAEDAQGPAITRAGDAVPMAPGQHEAVWLDHALGLDVATDRVVLAPHRAALLHGIPQCRELRLDVARSTEGSFFGTDVQLRNIERQLANRGAGRSAERRVGESVDALGSAAEDREIVGADADFV